VGALGVDAGGVMPPASGGATKASPQATVSARRHSIAQTVTEASDQFKEGSRRVLQSGQGSLATTLRVEVVGASQHRGGDQEHTQRAAYPR
jgi:hypothetical protein